MNIAKLTDWGISEDQIKPLIIAGPCSAESEEQIMQTATDLAAMNIPIFRAGIWKPRTRPGSFEGVGAIGLQWMKRAKQETGMLTATEVANPTHVFEAIKTGIDILWIGARTAVNPFAIQEIADSLKGVDIPVILKNPVNPDIDLWVGGIERLYNAGITKLAALHRGFSGLENSPLRNEPQWQLPIELRRRLPNLPLICDPSHICGRRDLLSSISQKAMDLDYQGLMLETHCNPEVALSDKEQQVTPEILKHILDGLVIRNTQSDDVKFQRDLTELRTNIDRLDTSLLELLGKRMEVAQQIGELKKDNNITVLQSGRWDEIVQRVHMRASKFGFSEEFTDKLFKAIHEESIRLQEDIMN
jgi:chorismate mutase